MKMIPVTIQRTGGCYRLFRQWWHRIPWVLIMVPALLGGLEPPSLIGGSEARQMPGEYRAAEGPGPSSPQKADKPLGVGVDNRAQAIKWYNQSIDQTMRGEVQNSIRAYHEAIRLNPGFLQAYNNLAMLYEQQSQYDQAIATYQKALAIQPGEPLLHRNLAVAYQKSEKILEAYHHYRQYVRLARSPDPQIVALVNSFDSKRAMASQTDNYASLATEDSRGLVLAWPMERMPLSVCVLFSGPEQAIFADNVRQGLKAWETALAGRIRFRVVESPEAAQVLITFQEGDPDASTNQLGHARFEMLPAEGPDPFETLRIRIKILTGPLVTGTGGAQTTQKERINRVILHELGHAIGIWGHSPDPGDMMFTHPIASRLSLRDIRTVRKLYHLE